MSGLMIAVGSGDFLGSSVRTSVEVEKDTDTATGEGEAAFGLGAAAASFDGDRTGAVSAVDWI